MCAVIHDYFARPDPRTFFPPFSSFVRRKSIRFHTHILYAFTSGVKILSADRTCPECAITALISIGQSETRTRARSSRPPGRGNSSTSAEAEASGVQIDCAVFDYLRYYETLFLFRYVYASTHRTTFRSVRIANDDPKIPPEMSGHRRPGWSGGPVSGRCRCFVFWPTGRMHWLYHMMCAIFYFPSKQHVHLASIFKCSVLPGRIRI